jgi:hypothetical protein
MMPIQTPLDGHHAGNSFLFCSIREDNPSKDWLSLSLPQGKSAL